MATASKNAAQNETTSEQEDERLANTTDRDERSSADDQRTQLDGTALTLEERIRQMRTDWNQEVLPAPPKKPGWHFCWLSTTNSADPIYKRVARGYKPVYSHELPGFAAAAEDGEFKGIVTCNEMLLFKIETELYQEIMKYLHHELPLGEEEILKANIKKDDADSDGVELGTVEGFTNLARNVRAPKFTD